ncbi:MAG: CHAT domain-containing protein [Sphingobacteriales bacterium]|nr:CHAT domain-containing protein [Sphingobacteriales bacterium]
MQQTVSICIELYEHTQQLDYWYQAFNFAEKSKSVLLLNAIKDAEAKLIANIDPSLIEKEKSIRQRLWVLDEKMLQERALSAPDTQRLSQWQAPHFDLYKAYEQLLQHLETTTPNYHYLKYSIGTTSVADLQAWLATQPQTALISYMVTANCLFVFVVTATHFEAMRLPMPLDFKIQIEEFMDSINCHNQDDYVEIGYELYQILLQKPLQIITQHLPNAQHLVIIPDNELCYLPFEALLSSPKIGIRPTTSCLMCYSNTILAIIIRLLLYETICQKRRSLLSDTFGGFAPVYTAKTNSNNKSAVSVNRSGIQYSELIFSEVELTNIAALFGQHQASAQLFLHQDASEENFKKHSAQYKYLHIAAHGVLNKKHPELSGILLAPQDDANSTEDGMLYIAETYHLELRADLVVLSCCESGIGQMIRGEGMMAINRGFLYAGAKNIIYTLFYRARREFGKANRKFVSRNTYASRTSQ